MSDAVCVTVGGDLWMEPEDQAEVRVAKALCRSCSALTQCLDWHLELGGIQAGVAAGMTARERTKAITAHRKTRRLLLLD